MKRGALFWLCAGGFSIKKTRRYLGALVMLWLGVLPALCAPGLPPNVSQQIGSLLEEKRSWTPIQAKLESPLIHAVKQRRGQPFGSVPGLQLDVELRQDGKVLVDVNARVSD